MSCARILILTITFIATYDSISAQEKCLLRDIDFDGVNDTIQLNVSNDIIGKIVCKLSSQHFAEISSLSMEYLNLQSGIRNIEGGFEFYNDWMRAGYACQFRYERNEKQIRLIGMSRYEYGNAVNDGSGESSINLLTKDYIGNWNYFDYEKEELISIPTIEDRMDFSELYLEDFDDETYFDFGKRCAELYHIYKDIKQNRKD